MVKLPDRMALGARDPRAVQRLPNYPDIPKNDPVGAAMQNFGGAVQGLGSTLMAKAEEQRREQERLEMFNQSNRLLQFEQQWDEHMQERLQTVEPGAAGFTASLAKEFDPQARKFMQGVPPALRPEIDQRLVRQRDSMKGRAQTFERNEAQRHSIVQATDAETQLLERAKQDPSAWREIEAEGAGIWDNNPHINNIDRHLQKQRWAERRAVAEFEQLDPKAARAALLPQGAGSFVEKVVGAESGGDPNAKNPLSTATGGGQFIEKTWRQFIAERHPELAGRSDVLALRTDMDLSREATAWYAHKNGKELKAAGLPVNDATLYLAHFAGPGGAVKILRADPNASAESVLGSAVVEANPFLKGMTAGEVGQWAQRKMGAASGDSSIDPRFAALDYEKRQVLLRQADARINQQKVEYLSSIEDYTAHVRAGNTVPDEGLYSLENLVDNLGYEDAEIVHEELRRAEAFGADVRADMWATPAERREMVAERQREMQERPGEFRANAGDLNGLLQAMEQRDAKLVKDPAHYVRQESGVADAYAALQAAEGEEVPVAAKAYATAALAMQERLGLPPEARRILSEQEADGIGRNWSEQMATEGGQKPVEIIRGLKQTWGEAFPQVLGELSGHIPGPAMVVGIMDRPDQMRSAESLSEAIVVGRAGLENMLLEETVKTINDELEAPHGMFSSGAGGALQEFQATLRYYPAGEAAQNFATVKESVHLLALQYATQGEDPSTAVERAAADIIGKSYNFSDSETFRVPVEHDIDAIEGGADRMLSNFDATGIDLPLSLIGLPEDHTRAAYQSQIRSKGFWVTNEDETGLTLFDEQGGKVTAGGKPVTMTWAQLQENSPPPRRFMHLLVPGIPMMP